ncbi:MAG: HAD family hydrolase [Methanocorpusculum sp.]|nr:HAD family hydrolase [Methanocorpusculum sp.]
MQTLLFAQFKAVMFDMDNTLFDFVSAMRKGCDAAIKNLGVGSGDELLGYYLRWKYHFEDHTNLQDFMLAHNCFTVEKYFDAVAAFEEAKLKDLTPYKGITEVLSELKKSGYKLAVVTDAFSYAAEKRLKYTGLFDYFDVSVCYDTTGYKKPHTAPFECALDMLGVLPHEAVYVGDSIRRDIEPSTALGITTIYAKYGDKNFFETASTECPPKVLEAESPQDILKLLM